MRKIHPVRNCEVDGCGKICEGDGPHCATHARAFRKANSVRPQATRLKIKPTTDKRAALKKIYLERRKTWLRGLHCAVYPEKQATQVHHIKGRLGNLLIDESNWLPVCAAGHEYIHEHPQESYEKGWMKLRSA